MNGQRCAAVLTVVPEALGSQLGQGPHTYGDNHPTTWAYLSYIYMIIYVHMIIYIYIYMYIMYIYIYSYIYV